jgi:hypothetical protein
VRRQSSDLAKEHANELTAFGSRCAEQLFCRQTEGVLLVHRRDVIEPVEIGESLQISRLLDQLLGPAMEDPDIWIDALHDFAVEREHEAQDTMRRRVLGPKVDGSITSPSLGHGALRIACECNAGCSCRFLRLSSALSGALPGEPLLLNFHSLDF